LPARTPDFDNYTAALQEAAMGKGKKAKADKAATVDGGQPKVKKHKKAKAKPAQPVAAITDTRSSTKADEFIADACKWGWEVSKDERAANIASVTVGRDDEAICISWQDGRFLENCTHTIGARTVKLRNASAARGAMNTPPEKVRRDVRQRVASQERGTRPAPVPPTAAKLPFDIKTSSDADIIAALLGRRISWWHPLTRTMERASIPATQFVPVTIKYKENGTERTRTVREQVNNRHVKIDITPAGRRVFTWVAPEGFRSVALDAIVRIG
jgi:hypothetical protein